MSATALWERVKTPDPAMTKPFESDGFQGTAISPMWFYRTATENFGPVGIGWGYTVIGDEIITAANGDQAHTLQLRLWYVLDGKRGEVDHFGQTPLCRGHRLDGDVKKKSLTDALTKAFSLLGFGADVYAGRFDDLKYVQSLVNAAPVANDDPVAKPAPAASAAGTSASAAPSAEPKASKASAAKASAPAAPAAASVARVPSKDSWITRIKTLGRDALPRVEQAVSAQFEGKDLEEILSAIRDRKAQMGVQENAA